MWHFYSVINETLFKSILRIVVFFHKNGEIPLTMNFAKGVRSMIPTFVVTSSYSR